MPCAVNFCSDKNEITVIENNIRDAAARITDENWVMSSFTDVKKFIEAYDCEDNINLSFYDITADGTSGTIENIRKINNDAKLVIIADTTISPLVYMKPGIMASSLLLKPLTGENVEPCVREILENHYAQSSSPADSANRFCVETKDEKSYYPYDKIIYFEAKEKKVFLNTAHSEEGFYSTLDELEQSLPACFARCHRSFIVNTSKIIKIQSAQNLIICEDGVMVPVSRSFKNSIKEIMGGKNE